MARMYHLSLTLFLSFVDMTMGNSCSVYNGGSIFCFGDELVAGISKKEDLVHTPFSQTVQRMMPAVRVSESGKYGEFTYHMRKRFEKEILTLTFTKPSVVVLWGGVNDVSKHVKINTTVQHITAMHETVRRLTKSEPLKYGGILHTILITVPQLKAHDMNRGKRLRINQQLRQYAASTDGFVLLLDIEDAFRYAKHCISNSNDKTHSNDIVHGRHVDQKCHKVPAVPEYKKYWDSPSSWHMSPLGYEAVGRMVYETACNQTQTYFLV